MVSRGLIVKVLHPYWRLTRGQTLGAQGMVLDDKNRVVLIRHTYRPGWHFPGGGVEWGETVEDALRRELLEEAGVIIHGAPKLFGLYANFEAFPRDHIAFFVVREWRQDGPPRANAEVAEQGLFAVDALPEGTVAGARHRIREVMEGLPPAAHW